MIDFIKEFFEFLLERKNVAFSNNYCFSFIWNFNCTQSRNSDSSIHLYNNIINGEAEICINLITSKFLITRSRRIYLFSIYFK